MEGPDASQQFHLGPKPPSSQRLVRVLVAAANAPTRAGVRQALEADGFEIVAEVGDASVAIELAANLRPDVCLIDTLLPGNGIRAAREIAADATGPAVVMLSTSDRSEDLFDALRAGAAGYLLADTDPGRLSHALRGVLAGEAAVPRRLVSRLIDELRSQGRRRRVTTDTAMRVELTSREWEVIELVRDGLTTNQTAERLFVSPVTVRRHVSTIVQKLGVADRDAAVRALSGQLPTG
jgi:DNA-binding NarL/FixJ family response regulator